jgi:C_GCAxxG_C_C family probable redox protein
VMKHDSEVPRNRAIRVLGRLTSRKKLNMSATETAELRFRDGYSCSQAVFSSLAERWGVSPDLSLRISAGFGGGIARSAGTCGCVTGALMALGLAQTGIEPSAKDKTTELCRQFMRTFQERNGSTVCSELLGCDISTPEGLAIHRQGVHRSLCTKLVRGAVEIVDSILPAA